MAYILAGDVGGTKTVLAIFKVISGSLYEVCNQTYPSGEHQRFEDLLQQFLKDEVPAELATGQIQAAVFGIAGPINKQKCVTTNLPWFIDGQEVSTELNISKVHLLNDLESAAYGVLQLEKFHSLNPDGFLQDGHIAVIAAGTGLGEAIMYFDGKNHHAMPTEGGHCEFAPQSEIEDELLLFLRERFKAHISVERILSGDGFGTLYDFFKSKKPELVNKELEQKMRNGDRNAIISQAGLQKTDAICQDVMSLFCRIYGAEAGNLALKCLPLGGVYIAGGIAPKIRPALESGGFMQGFLDKGRMTHAIEHIPVRIVDDPEAPLLGAAHFAARLV